MYEAWRQYEAECRRKMFEDPPPTSESTTGSLPPATWRINPSLSFTPIPGLVCNRTFDMYACWEDALPNTSAKVPCPWYLPWHQQVESGFVLQRCGPDGQWLVDESGLPWRDHSQCESPPEELPFQVNPREGEVHQGLRILVLLSVSMPCMDSWQCNRHVNSSHRSSAQLTVCIFAFAQKHLWILEQFRLMYTVGYSLSLVALMGALALLAAFRQHHGQRVDPEPRFLFLPPLSLPDVQAVAGCRLAQILTQYCVCANYYWLLVEGLYLHNLLGLMAFSEESYFPGYLLIGWGESAGPSIVMGNSWGGDNKVIGGPVCCLWRPPPRASPSFFSILQINFGIFIRIIKILLSKLRAQQMRYTDYKFRLAKSTLTLIPLLGIHEIVFALLTEEQAQGTLRYVKYFFELFLNSFQGLLVSILYCFINKEVQSEIRRKWQRCQLGASLLEKHGSGWTTRTSLRSQSSHRKKASGPQPPNGPGNPAGTLFPQTHLGGKSYHYLPVWTGQGKPPAPKKGPLSTACHENGC
ncbi:hypothetical protein lerEdw1_009665 [Lerista edwardsae]|nr:hypothetical protein lerEdw1_009665 [Lerista edwardsae]